VDLQRPVSSSKFQELSGHNVFAIANESDTPPPPPRVPYMPEERVIPPHDMPRNVCIFNPWKEMSFIVSTNYRQKLMGC
jgi:hypothetical protein